MLPCHVPHSSGATIVSIANNAALTQHLAAEGKATAKTAPTSCQSWTESPSAAPCHPWTFLDHHIQLGGHMHARQLSGIPLTSQSSVSWTHFGGVPPTDEVNA